MGAERTSITIGELIVRSGGSIKTGPFGTTLKASEYSTTGVPLISVGEIGHGEFRVHERTPRVPKDVTSRLAEYLLREGDIVFGRKGAVDRSVRASAKQDGWFLGSDGIRLRLPATADSRFVAFQLQSQSTRRWILQHATGTTMASLNQDIIGRIPILLPPLTEQRAIADILGSLDDKIELNRRMNETLEAMARALFKSWFVDFDPVRAKAEGRAPSGMDEETSKLFPSGFGDSALGPLPHGWEATRLGALLELKRGYDLPTADRLPGSVPIISSSGVSGSHSQCAASAPGVVTGRYGTIGKVFYVSEDFWPLNTTLYVCDFKNLEPLYAYYLLRLLDFTKFSDKGAVPGVNRNHLHEEPMIEVPRALQSRFCQIARPLMDLAVSNEQQARGLGLLRDSLLPRLLSGEIDVSDAERFVGAAT